MRLIDEGAKAFQTYTQGQLDAVFNKSTKGPTIAESSRTSRTLTDNVQGVFQRVATDFVGGERVVSNINQQLQKVNSFANQYGVSFTWLQDIINQVFFLPRLQGTGVPNAYQPNIILGTIVNGKPYVVKLFESEDNLEFTDAVNWSETEILGRPSKVFAFSSSNSTDFAIRGYLKIDSEDDTPLYDKYMANIKAMRFPVNNGIGITGPPIWTLVYLHPSTYQTVFQCNVRVISVNWSFMKPYLPNNRPTITNISLSCSKVEDTLLNSQATYLDQLLTNIQKNYFSDKAVSESNSSGPALG